MVSHFLCYIIFISLCADSDCGRLHLNLHSGSVNNLIGIDIRTYRLKLLVVHYLLTRIDKYYVALSLCIRLCSPCNISLLYI